MEIYKYEYGKALDISPSVIALGFFDGVTIAHRRLIEEAREEADKRALPLGIFTFDSEGSIKKDSKRIYSTEQKLTLFERCGVDFAVVADFSDLCSLSPEEFVKDVIVRDLGAVIAASGYNFRFGRGAAADANDLCVLMQDMGKSAITVSELSRDGEAVSASRIRDLLSENRIREAESLLGAPYFIVGTVTAGNAKGRDLGFPTINTNIDVSKVAPKGVFRSAVPIGDRIFHAVTNIGTCPTFDERSVHAETHIIDYLGDLYGKRCEVYLLGYLRSEIKFDSPEALIKQIQEDKLRAISENGDLTWQRLGLK